MDVKSFKGLNNVSDPMRLDMSWLVQADNVNITDTGGLAKRDGYTLVRAGSSSSAYSTLDFNRMYTAGGSALRDFDGNQLVALASTAPMYWCEVNFQVFFNNGTDSGVIMPDDTVLPWSWPTPTAPSVAAVTGKLPAGAYQVRCTYLLADGRETGAGEAAEITLAEGQALQISAIPSLPGNLTNVYITPADSTVYQLAYTTTSAALTFNTNPNALGRDLLNAFLDPLPDGTDVVQVWRGRVYACQYMASEKQTVVWFSEALGYHLFNLNSNFIIVPGRVLMLAPHDSALLIGTDARVYAYTGDKIEQLADYGVVPGQHWSRDDEPKENPRVLFWTTRGLCAALPFANLTEKQISVAPGIGAAGIIMHTGGQKRYVVAVQPGLSAFNAYVPIDAGALAPRVYEKDPDATVTYTFDWAPYLMGATITAVVWLAEAPLTTGAGSFTNSTASVTVSGGAAGTQRALTCRVTTSAGGTDDQSITLSIINF